MSLKGIYNTFVELYFANNMKNSGYSIFDVTGEDGVTDSFFKQVGREKKVNIGKGTYIVNRKKRGSKWDMPYYQFNNSAIGIDPKTNESVVTKVDAEILSELLSKARLVGQNSMKGAGNMYLYLAMGGAVGFLLAWVIKTAFGG